MDELIQFLREHAGVESLALVFSAAASEYLLPPLPADTVVVASSLLVLAGAWSFPMVLVFVVAGGVFGSIAQYFLGRYLSDGQGGFRGAAYIHRVFGSQSTENFVHSFQKHGYWVIAINRFLPGVRAGVFLMSGALKLDSIRVITLGFLSNLAWSTLLLGLGVTIGDNLEKIQSIMSVYKYTAGGIMIAFVGVFAYRKWTKRKL